MNKITDKLNNVLADTYTLYLKTQNYHWNVTGFTFDSLHQLFGRQYTELALAVDEIAERLRALGVLAPATFKEFGELKSIKEGKANLSAEEMLEDLRSSHEQVVQTAKLALDIASKEKDDFTVDMLTQRIGAHQKEAWMISATLAGKPSSLTLKEVS